MKSEKNILNSGDAESVKNSAAQSADSETAEISDADAENEMSELLKLRDRAASVSGKEAAAMAAELKNSVEQAVNDVPKRSKGSKIFIIIIAILVVLGIVRGVQLQMQQPEDEETVLTNVKVQTVEMGSVELTTPLAGRIQAKDTVNVVPLASGEVEQVFVKVGDTVSAGQTLFTINSSQANIQYEQAQLNIKNLEDAIKLLETNLERTKALYEAGAAAKTDVESLENQYSSTLIQLEQARLNAKSASDALSYYNVTAPSGGYVTAVNVVAGGLAGQGGAAVSISDTSVLELSASVSEYLISSISTGQKVDVYVESASDEAFKGTITRISEAPVQGTFTYPVTIILDDPEGLIKAGMFAEVRLISARKENVVTVPSDAVITSSGEKKVVVYSEEDGTVSMKTVTVGVDNGTVAEIVSGLSRGETVVIKGQTYVKDGELVNVVG